MGCLLQSLMIKLLDHTFNCQIHFFELDLDIRYCRDVGAQSFLQIIIFILFIYFFIYSFLL